jgi:hypothetical protein
MESEHLEREPQHTEQKSSNILSLAAAAHNLIAVSYILYQGECVRNIKRTQRAHTDITINFQ